jgi:hypothetical protein
VNAPSIEVRFQATDSTVLVAALLGYTLPSTATTPPPSNTPSLHTGLSTGAKVGISIGVALGALLMLTVFICYILSRRHKKRNLSTKGGVENVNNHQQLYPGYKSELDGSSRPERLVFEAHNSEPETQELDSRLIHQSHPVELSVDNTRGGSASRPGTL